MVLSIVFAILGGWGIDRYGPRIITLLMGLFVGLGLLLTSQTNSLWQLFLTYSLLLSIGIGAIYPIAMTTISRWFNKKRGLALGIAHSGVGLGQVIMAPFATFLISTLNWRRSYIVIGLISLIIAIPLSRLVKKDPNVIGALPDGAESSLTGIKEEEENASPINFSLFHILKTKSFWLIICIWLLFGYSYFLVLTHFIPHATDIDFSAGEAAVAISLMGGISIAGSVLIGRVSDSIGRKPIAIICAILQAGSMLWLVWAQDLWMLYLFALIYGFANGGLAPSITALIGDTFGLRNIGVIFGLLEIGWGIGSAIGPAIGGLIFDMENSYSMAFLIGAAAMLIVAFLATQIKRETSGGLEGIAKDLEQRELVT
jgi:MFS family permease